MTAGSEHSDERDLADHLRLALLPGIGPRLRRALLDAFGSPAEVLRASPQQLALVPGIGPKLSGRIVDVRDSIDVASELALARQHGIQLMLDTSAEYPPLLAEIPDPPGVLYLRGTLASSDGLAVAIVGSRHATRYGLEQAERLAASLARAGVTIVSGLARGIDAAAHRGALAAGGRTLAVLGSGLLEIYPPEHAELAAQIAGAGAVLSENALRGTPLPGTFPQRNRLISGLTLGTIVVEAAERSGALITARHAYEQGREVFAVPGRVDNRLARGCHRLIRDGAKLVETADDVLEELGPLAHPVQTDDATTVRHPAELKLNDVERIVLAALDGETTAIDTVVAATGLAASQVSAALAVLEVRRLVRRVSGQLYARR
ncbi:MAG: DNA-processing protein DprA [Pirellulales bacterium]|nr:DNA-processing protein DprA [Pirellulales bacterium]